MVQRLNFDEMISSIACNDKTEIEKIITLGSINRNNKSDNFTSMKIRFLENPFNSVFLKREETREFVISSNFSFNPLPGECLAILENGIPAFSLYKNQFYFNFDPFYSIRYYLNEKDKEFMNKYMNRQVLKLYWKFPKNIRQISRKIIRRKKRGVIYSPNQFLATHTNILGKLIEECVKFQGITINKFTNAFAITHDIDTEEGYNYGIYLLRDSEKKLKVPATGFFIPFGREYKPDVKALQALSSDSFEIGMHGYSHDGFLLRESQESCEKKLIQAQKFFQDAGIELFGFRSPWTLRKKFLLDSLCKLGFHYDSSYPDKDTLSLTHPLEGLHYNRPIIRKKIVEGRLNRNIIQIPISYPQDVQILEDYRLKDEEAFKYFKVKIDFIKDFEGIFVFHTHPIHIESRLELFEDVVNYARSIGFKALTMKDISTHILKS